MDTDANAKNAFSMLYPTIEPFRSYHFDTEDGHTIYVEECGNANGIPVLVLHGGPGGGCSPTMRRYFDPEYYRIVLFDQRGCGRSRPYASVSNNTTWHLVDDIETIREQIGVDRWLLFGGSWGSTLALVYGQRHPERVLGFVLRGIFLMTRPELDWFYGGGAAKFWPEDWENFVTVIPEDERDDLIKAYNLRLFSGNPNEEDTYAQIWATWENALASMRRIGSSTPASRGFARAFARIENHYFTNSGFSAPDQQILANMSKIAHLPAKIVQGRYDLVTPPKSAYDLHKHWPASELTMASFSGHAMTEANTTEALLRATDSFRATLSSLA